MSRRWLVPVGTNRELIKLAPVVEAMRNAGDRLRVVGTGERADPLIEDPFVADLGLVPDERWQLPAGTHARIGGLVEHACDALASRDHDAVLALGDTYTIPSFALAARRHGLPFVHVEAGLRSLNPQSARDGNSRVGAALGALHLAPTECAARLLASEGVAEERVRVVGNPVTDVLRRFGPKRRRRSARAGVLVTVQRPANLVDRARLHALVRLVRTLGAEIGNVRFPMHPRTRDRLLREGLHELAVTPGVVLEPPLRYRELLEAVAGCAVVVTDSRGLQEEASWYGVPLVVLRNSTPRWEHVHERASVLVGDDVDAALDAVRLFLTADEQARVAAQPCPYGDGRVAPRIAALLADAPTDELLTVREPPLLHALPEPESRRIAN
jgi:UDP-N-acetylglucosamine 2-epimerase (non-hydrolysing)